VQIILDLSGTSDFALGKLEALKLIVHYGHGLFFGLPFTFNLIFISND